MDAHKQFDYRRVRADFPILSTEVRGKPLTYLDSAATSQKPLSVIEAVDRYYRFENSNIHRGVHYLSEQATDAYEVIRSKVANFIGAADANEVVPNAERGNCVDEAFRATQLGKLVKYFLL